MIAVRHECAADAAARESLLDAALGPFRLMKFGFMSTLTGGLWLPGPGDPQRLLALELEAGALTGAAVRSARPDSRRPNRNPMRSSPGSPTSEPQPDRIPRATTAIPE